MSIPDKYIYLTALIPFLLIWVFIFIRRKDLRREIIFISLLASIFNVLSSYLWWTKDWWRPPTITGTVVGVEDMLLGFFCGGIMSVIYDLIFNKKYSKRALKHRPLNAYIFLIFSTSLMAWLFYRVGLTSFWSSTISMILFVIFMIYIRKDLFFNALVSGTAMMAISILFYIIIITLSNTWIDSTYLPSLSGFRIWNVPVEEFVFWFLAGMWIGPFYEYSLGKKLKSIAVK